jgi:hypothetical protein
MSNKSIIILGGAVLLVGAFVMHSKNKSKSAHQGKGNVDAKSKKENKIEFVR